MRPGDEVVDISNSIPKKGSFSVCKLLLREENPICIYRTVTTEESTGLCSAFAGCGFVETSAKKNWNIDELFRQLFQLADLPPEMAPNSHRRLLPTQVIKW